MQHEPKVRRNTGQVSYVGKTELSNILLFFVRYVATENNSIGKKS